MKNYYSDTFNETKLLLSSKKRLLYVVGNSNEVINECRGLVVVVEAGLILLSRAELVLSSSRVGLRRRVGTGANLIADVVKIDGATAVLGGVYL